MLAAGSFAGGFFLQRIGQMKKTKIYLSVFPMLKKMFLFTEIHLFWMLNYQPAIFVE